MLPLRNVAFDDDFAYIRTAERLVKTNHLIISDWASAAVVFQSYWGAIFSKLFGYSIKILHLSNIVISYFGLIAFYYLLKLLKIHDLKASFYTLLLLSFPWIFNFIFSFMSDTFYMSLLIISIYFYVKGLQTKSRYNYFIGSIFSGFAFLSRQTGISIPLSITAIFIFQSLFSKKFLWKELLYSLSPFLVIYIIYSNWLGSGGLTAAQIAYGIPAIKKSILSHLLPFYLGHIAITNALYIENLIQRGLGNFNSAIVFLLPILFINKILIIPAILTVKRNIKPIIITFLMLLAAYYINYINGSRYSAPPYHLILNYSTWIDWNKYWPYLIYISLPFWIVTIVLLSKKFFHNLFVKRQHPYIIFFKYMIRILIFSYLYMFILICIKTFPYVFYPLRVNQPQFIVFEYLPALASLYSATLYVITLIAHPEIISLTFKDSWFFFLIISSLVISFLYMISYFKLRKKWQKRSVQIFLLFVFISQYIVVSIISSGYWTQYIIPLIPLVILFIALLFRKLPFSIPQAIIVLLLIFSFSLQLTRNRYQRGGSCWEIAAKLVEIGVSPDRIFDVNWAWRPYWFFEKAFEDEVKKSGETKDKVAARNLQYWSREFPKGDYYEVISTPKQTQFNATQKRNIIFESKPYWLFPKLSLIYERCIIVKSETK